MRLPDPPLLLVTDRGQARRPLAEIVAAACAAGCRWISLREKDLAPADQVALARALLPLTRGSGALLTLHGEAATARAAGVDGVHLPSGGDVAGARAVLGEAALIGCSVHRVTELGGLAATTVDYVVAGPAHATASKPGYGPALDVVGVAGLAQAASVPVIAIGGIDAGNLAPLVQAGAGGVAVMGAVMRAADPGEEVRALLRALVRARAVREQC
jgi:thiamine-phosphate pyrophosphorylase